MCDTENGRGELPTTDPLIISAYADHEGGMYDYLRFDPPFSPERYTEHVAAMEAAGYTVGIVDSGSHEYDGIGGVTESAESEKNRRKGNFGRWADPKIRHRRFVNHLITSKMHLIICLRAEQKTAQIKAGDPIVRGAGEVLQAADVAKEDMIISRGLQPICEKKFQFEMTLSFLLGEGTHQAVPIKVPGELQALFPLGSKRLISRKDGELIAHWNNDAPSIDTFERVRQRAKTAAEDGMGAYSEFWKGISKEERKALAADHEVNKATAARVDAADADIPTYNGDLPDPMSLAVGSECWHVTATGKERLRVVDAGSDLQEWRAIA
jgi:hypothetical protein